MTQNSRADPFVRPSPTREGIVGLAALVATVWGIVYVAWRAFTTMDNAHIVSGSVLLAAELLAVAVFALRVRSARSTPVTAIDAPGALVADLTVVIDASGVSIDELRTTLVSVARLEGSNNVTIVGADETRRLSLMADRFGATVMDSSVRVHRAVGAAPTTWVLRLRAGDIAIPDLVTMCAPVCAAPEVGVVQVGIEEADPGSYEHDPDGRWSLDPFDQQVVRPSLASRGSIPWFGGEPVLVRTEAFLRAEEGRDGETFTDTERGIAIQGAGFHVTCVPVMLARIRGPLNLGESLSRRQTRLRAQVKAAIGAPVRSLPRNERWSHRVALVGPLAALQRLLLAAAALLVLGFAQRPFDAAPLDLLVIAAPAYVLRWNAHLLLGRGRLGPFSIFRSDLRTISADLFLFRSERHHRGSNLRLLMVVVVALDVAVAVTALSAWRDWAGRLSAETTAIALALTAGFLGVATGVLLDALIRRQRRRNHRVRLDLVTCLFQQTEGVLVDLSTGGACIALSCHLDAVPQAGTVTTLAFRIPDAVGSWRNVSTLVRVAYVTPGVPGETKIGLTFDDPIDGSLDPVIEFLTIDRRLVTLGRRTMAKG